MTSCNILNMSASFVARAVLRSRSGSRSSVYHVLFPVRRGLLHFPHVHFATSKPKTLILKAHAGRGLGGAKW